MLPLLAVVTIINAIITQLPVSLRMVGLAVA